MIRRLCLLLALLLALASPAFATISITSYSQTFQGNGATTVFTFGFVAGTASNVSVTFTDASGNVTVLSPAAYTLSITAPASGQCWGVGGTVTYSPGGSPIASGTTLTVARLVPYTQLTSVGNQASYLHAIECAMDQIVMQTQQIAGQVTNSIATAQAANTFLAGPPSAPNALPTYRKIVGADLNGLGLGTTVVNNTTITQFISPVTLSTNPLLEQITNSSTGTTANKIAKIVAGQAQTVTTSDTTGEIIGVCDSNCGPSATFATANIAVIGQESCVFDAATTAGDFVVVSTTTAGDCHDGGASVPTGVQVLGIIYATNGSAGTYKFDLDPVGVAAAIVQQGNGKGTVNSGTAGQLGYYATSSTAMSGTPNASISAGALTLGASGTAGSLTMGNATSGLLKLQPVTGALGTPTISVPAVTDTLAVLGTADQGLSGGFTVTSNNLGTVSSGTTTIDCGVRPLQYLTDNGAFTLAAPSSDGSCDVLVTNGASAGTISFSGFTVGASTGDALDTVNTHKFTIGVWRINGTAGYRVAAHQ